MQVNVYINMFSSYFLALTHNFSELIIVGLGLDSNHYIDL